MDQNRLLRTLARLEEQTNQRVAALAQKKPQRVWKF